MAQPLEAELLLPGPRYKEGMSTRVRFVLSDVDDTILPHGSLGLPSPRVIQAFHDAGEKALTGLATARPPQKSEYLISHLRLTGKSILSNGAQIYDGAKGLMVVERQLSIYTAMDIARALQANKIDHWIQDDGVDYRWVSQDKVARQAKATSEGLGLYRRPKDVLNPKKGLEDVPSYIPNRPFVIVAHHVDAAAAIAIQDMVKGYKDERTTAFIVHEYKSKNGITFDVFITDRKANKLEALHEIEQIERIPLDEFIAIGDGRNDKVLIENVGFGVTMGNAAESLKQVAAFIAPNRDQDGAAVAIEQLVLKKASEEQRNENTHQGELQAQK